jgi:uncharacterized integral membrane protein
MKARTRQNIRIGVISAAVAILLILFMQNTRQVTVTILFQSFSMPLVVLLILTAALSFVMGYFVHGVMNKRRKG